jgi:FMN phosphatase YigB (HAD superfamily)
MKLITFDFWNTLFLDQHEEIRHRKRIGFALETFRKYKPTLEVEQVEVAFQSAHQRYLQQWDNRKAFTMNLHVRHLLAILDLEVGTDDFESVVDFFESVLLGHPPILINNAMDAVRFSCSKMKVGLISDTGYSPGRTLRKLLARHGLEDCFHAFSFSNETGLLKPHPQCFHKILDQLQIAPEEAAHIGDLEETDVSGAKQIGMKAIKYIGANPSSSRESIADHVIDDLADLRAILG